MIDEQDKLYEDLHKQTKSFIDRNCIVRNTRMPGKLPGTQYTWMFYLRNGLFNPEFMQAIATMFLIKAEKEIGHFNYQLTGLETASTPMLSAFPIFARMYDIDLSAFSIRKERKEYGLLNHIEGVVNPELPSMIIDDLCNSSASMRKAYDVLVDHSLPIFEYAFCIVNKVNKGVHSPGRVKSDMYLPPEIKMLYLFDLDDFGLDNPSH